ncbi:hypothetical protein MBLNU230_g7348t1 [Neophaeotheca triangularis]
MESQGSCFVNAPLFPPTLVSSADFVILKGFVKSGYIVSAADYEGPDAVFSAGRLSGTISIDSIRATGNFKNTLGFSSNTPDVAGFGYSGEASASG